MKKRRFSSEFKREAVQLARDSGKSITQVARELGLGVSLLAKWVREAQAAETKSGKKPDADEELRAARKEIARLKMEVEILGKAAASSTGHRYTVAKRIGWSSESQGLPWSLVELTSDLVQLRL